MDIRLDGFEGSWRLRVFVNDALVIDHVHRELTDSSPRPEEHGEDD